jgi:hypothetical protein
MGRADSGLWEMGKKEERRKLSLFVWGADSAKKA